MADETCSGNANGRQEGMKGVELGKGDSSLLRQDLNTFAPEIKMSIGGLPWWRSG